MKKTILIFSGYNQRALIAFLRTLRSNNIENYVIVALSREDDILKTEYRHKVGVIRTSKELNVSVFKHILDKIRKQKDELFFVIPSSEYFNRFLLRERKTIEEMGCEIPLAEKELYEMISDKERFNRICRQHGISVPDKIEFPDNFKRAFAAKPKNYISSNGNVYAPILVRDEDAYKELINHYPLEDFFYEEFVEGKNFYLLYYFGKNNTVFSFSQENLVQQPHGKSMVAARSAGIHREKIGRIFENLFRELEFTGLVMVEVRVQENGYSVIEANPRLWGPSQLFVDAGCNFFEILLKEAGLLEKEIIFEERNVLYFWNGGICQTWNKGEKLAFFSDGEEELFVNFCKWMENEIYRRTDTRELFMTGK